MESTLARIQRWYAAQCDGDWEHRWGVKVETLDNPGWSIKINLAGTALEGLPFAALSKGLEVPSSTDWHSVSVKDNAFEAAGDPSKLEFMLNAFVDWAERLGGRSVRSGEQNLPSA